MPGKSRRDRARRSARSKKGQGTLAGSIQQRVSADRPAAPAASASVPAPIATPTGAGYPYIISELRRIGLLAAVVLAILVILAFVLP